jgi:soluble lytic murein transglycosylase
MLSRFIVAFIIFISASITASAAPLFPFNDPALLEAVKEFNSKNFATAKELAIKAPESPARDFVLGMSSYRLEKWNDAAESLAKSTEEFPLLADYSLYYRADSLFRVGSYDEADRSLLKLEKHYPDSPLIRSASLLHADTLFEKKDYSKALVAYQKYMELYPSGTKSLKASYQAALCLEALGDVDAAVRQLRSIWLKHPSSQVASLAETSLQKLKTENVTVPPYTPEEIFNRGVILYDLGKYSKAMKTFTSLPQNTLSEDLVNRLELKIGKTQFRSRHYKDAARTLAKQIMSKDPELSCEASYWLARSLSRSGNGQQAFDLFIKTADTFPQSALSDDALLHAAMIRKYDGENDAAIAILDKLISAFPSSSLKPKALWETAWIRYLGKDYKGAAKSLNALLNYSSYREKALYWLGRSEQASGDKDRAISSFTKLLVEYPYGFYSLRYLNYSGSKYNRLPSSEGDIVSSLPIPAGYDRIKCLISLGLNDEARIELASFKKKASFKNRLREIARLYWEMKDYRSAMGLFRKAEQNSALAWNLNYPLGFSKHVSRCAENLEVPKSLAYSIIRSESSFSASVRSGAGAVGLMQVMPATARFIYKKKSEKFDSSMLTHPDLNINLGMKHIKYLINRFDGNLILAIAAYNSGESPVDRWLRNFPGLREDEFIENIPYPETREYVKKVLTSMVIYKSLYGLDEEPMKKPNDNPEEPVHSSSGISLSSNTAAGNTSVN